MKTFSRWPLLTTTFSAVFEPLQLGSWLMSILAGFGAAPSNFTVPLTLAAVAGSMGVGAGADAGVAAGCSVVASLLPPQPIRTNASKAGRLQPAIHLFVFIVVATPL